MARINKVAVLCLVIFAALAGLNICLAADQDNNSYSAAAGANSQGNLSGPQGGPGSVPDPLKQKAIVNEPWEKLADTNKDGIVDRTEINQWRQGAGQNSNSSGPMGSVSTGEENYSGSQSSTGVSSDAIQGKAVVDRPWEKAADANKDGIVDRTEINQWRQGGLGQNNNPYGVMTGPGSGQGNPPGPVGGPGTDWGNPPGPAGGPGVSPDKKPAGNPPGPRGGPGAGPRGKK